MEPRYFVSHTNPEPWAIGTISYGRMSPNLNLDAYKRSVKEEFDGVEMLPTDYRKFTFYFWRQQAKYLDMNDKKRQRNQADATNMQKALEDALQGVLFKNDRDTLDIRSVIVRQGSDITESGTIIKAEWCPVTTFSVLEEIPPAYVEQINNPPHKIELNNKWDAEDMF